ncbi:MAG: TetR/AcrR family transcriptional regulator [Lachnospiraceae bacterium]|nr:TetR/AcrR family transcriptional regulator [Lachnospiraceae bacterium]
MNESDERYSTAEDAIFDAFFALLKEKEFDKITVADISKKAGVVRSTFYNHYENVPALVEAAEDRTIRDIFSMMESFHPKDDRSMCNSYFLAICNYTRKNPFVVNLLKSPRGDAFFEKAIMMFHDYVKNLTSASGGRENPDGNASYLIAGMIGTTIGILHKWISDGFSEPAEKISEVLTRVFLAGFLPFL